MVEGFYKFVWASFPRKLLNYTILSRRHKEWRLASCSTSLSPLLLTVNRADDTTSDSRDRSSRSRDLSMVFFRHYVQMSRSRLGLESWRLGLGLDLDLSGFEPIAIFTQIYWQRFVTKTLSLHKLNRSVNNNPWRMQQNSIICTSSL